nr:rod shape-determining protein MreD [Pseudoflavonifractor phocaeensis]
MALLPVWFCQAFVLNRLPFLPLTPMLLPLAAVCVAVLEGAVAGAGFGLAVGVLCDAVYFGTDGAMTVGVCVVGMAAGALAQYLLRQNLLGCLLCSLLALAAMDGVRILTRLFWGDWELGAMLSLAGREILLSLIFVFPVYALFLWVYRRVPKKTVL